MTIETAKRRPPNAGKGRPKGTSNRLTADIKAMIEEALHRAGGVEYLVHCATHSDPRIVAAYLRLVEKLLPHRVDGPKDIVVTWES